MCYVLGGCEGKTESIWPRKTTIQIFNFSTGFKDIYEFKKKWKTK